MAVLCSLHTSTDTPWVDNTAHTLHYCGKVFSCDREIEALSCWNGHPLLLSSDTDCLSLWDNDGPVRLCRVGVYPQDMTIADNTAYVCGGADGRLHLLSLPSLEAIREINVPGMPERITLRNGTAWLLTLLPEPAIQTALLEVDLISGSHRELTRYAGVPGALCTDRSGLWVAVSEQLLHFRHTATAPDFIFNGFGLIHRLRPSEGGVVAIDTLEERVTWVCATPEPAIVPLPCCAADFALLSPSTPPAHS